MRWLFILHSYEHSLKARAYRRPLMTQHLVDLYVRLFFKRYCKFIIISPQEAEAEDHYRKKSYSVEQQGYSGVSHSLPFYLLQS